MPEVLDAIVEPYFGLTRTDNGKHVLLFIFASHFNAQARCTLSLDTPNRARARTPAHAKIPQPASRYT